MSHYPDSEPHKRPSEDTGLLQNQEEVSRQIEALRVLNQDLEDEFNNSYSENGKPQIFPDPNGQPDQKRSIGLFTLNSANGWLIDAKGQPIPRMLFDVFWFEGELCILYADTNLGKSILAVQFADSITYGKPIPGFRLQAQKQSVLYLDCELTAKQFEARYSNNFTDHYNFSDLFYRLEINSDADLSTGFLEAEMYKSVEKSIVETGSKVLIVDNITYLKNETERAKDALPLMKHLKTLKTRFGLSILALAHTPKRDLSKPITRNDLQGSKMLINFCDSAFAIGESHRDSAIRYLKQIKSRNTELIYDGENVAICTIEKPDNFLGFQFIGTGPESDHLRSQTEAEGDEMKQKVMNLNQIGMTQRDIANELGLSLSKVNRLLKSVSSVSSVSP